MYKFNLLLLLFALSAVTFVGCDSNGDGDGDSSDVLGRWVNTEVDEFLNISSDEIVVHDFVDNDSDEDNCYERSVVEVVDIDGDEWTIRNDDGGETATTTVRLELAGDDLVVSFASGDEEGSERYERSTQTDFTPLCN